jgi:hypothetical protein
MMSVSDSTSVRTSASACFRRDRRLVPIPRNKKAPFAKERLQPLLGTGVAGASLYLRGTAAQASTVCGRAPMENA